ncbi:hypothetical protein [[Eubacterium] cellulosolvens]
MKTQSAYLIYFTQDAWNEIEEVWNLFSNTTCNIDLKNDQANIRSLCGTSFSFQNKTSEIALYAYRDTIVVCLFSESPNTRLFEESLQKLKITPVARSSIAIGKIMKIEDKRDTISLEGGELKLYAGETNSYIYSTSLKKDLKEFITTTFIRLDIALHRLSKFSTLFRRQIDQISDERVEINKSVGQTLHKGITKDMPNEERLMYQEKRINDLSKMFEKLVNHGITLKSSEEILTRELREIEEFIVSKEFKPGRDKIRKKIRPYLELNEAIDREYRLVENAVQNIRAAIQVVQTKVGLIRSSETVTLQRDTKRLQEEGISLQMAASFIEFVIVFYYGLGVWKILADDVFHHIPAWIVFVVISSFALSVTALTHFIGKSRMHNWKISRGLVISAGSMISIWIIAEILTWLARELFS